MNLSKEKLEILKDTFHNIKIVAGPGSGKTTLLIEKIKLLVQEGVHPERILLVTYTNKSSKDLFYKLSQNIPNKRNFYIGTIHKFCTIFMRQNPQFFLKYKDFEVLDEYRQFLFFKKFIRKIKPLGSRLEISELRDYFGRIKDNYFFEEIEKTYFDLKDYYLNYCKILEKKKKFDFGDLIHVVIKEIKSNKDLQTIAKNKFDYIFVDEYQDINRVQEALLKLFLRESNKIWVVGDKNQSIYGFRGSNLKLFDDFEKNFPNVKTYTIKKNYRSTQKIIDFSNFFMDLKEPVLGNLDSSDGSITPKGSKVLIKDFDCEKAELKWFVEYIKKLKKEKIIQNYSDIGVLFKSIKHQAKTHIKSLEEENIPVEVLGYSDLSNLNYIKEILCVFKEFNNNSRISNKFLELEVSKGFNSKRPLDLLYEILSNSNWFKNKIKNNDDNVLFNIASLSKILEIYQSTFNTNLDEFYKYFKNEFIDYFDTERPKNTNSVKVLTFHKSKGLEFPIVIIPRVDKNFFAKKEKDFLHSLFPDYDSTADFKRAKYVAITRARDLLVFSSVRGPPIELIKNRTLVYVSSNIANNILMQTEEIPKVRSVKEKEEIITLNHYKLEEFLKCPFSYKLRFYNKFSVLSNYALIYGAKLHGAVYRLNLLINKENINKDLEDLIKQSKYESQLKEKLERYLIDFNEETKDALLFPEKTFYSIVDGVIIKGKIDLLIQKSDDVKIICEFKSGSYNKIFEEKAKRQLELYFLALNDSKIKKGIIYFFGNPSKKIVFDFSPQTNLKLMEILNKIKLKNFEPDTKNCNLLNKCVFAKICPHYNKDAINGINEYYEDDNTDLELDDY